jgi:hypothetical protein
MISCVNCKKEQDGPGKVWPPGWGCLHGMLACCSLACAEAFHASDCTGPFEFDADINGPASLTCGCDALEGCLCHTR